MQKLCSDFQILLRRATAALLLLVLGFYVSPKKQIHELFGTHHAGEKLIAATGKVLISESKTECHCDTPFLGFFLGEAAVNHQGIYPVVFADHPVFEQSLHFKPVINSLRLRGPPAAI